MEIFEAFQSISDAINQIKGKDILGVSSALVALIRLYRIIPKAPWVPANLEWVVQVGLFWVGYIAAALTGALGFKMGWGDALVGAVAVAVNASGIHAVTRAAGQIVRTPVAENKPNAQNFMQKLANVFLPAPKK